MAIKSKIQKLKDIVEGNTIPRPVGEDWYKNRLEICKTCPLNSNNPEATGKTWFREFIVAKRDKNGEYCTACGCPIDRKAALQRSICGIDENEEMIQAGMKPKWFPVSIENDDSEFFRITNINHEQSDMSYDEKLKTFDFDFGKTDKQVLRAKFQIYSPYKCEYKALDQDPCFFLNFTQGEDYLEAEAAITTTGFRENTEIIKNFTVYFQQNNSENKAEFRIKAFKTETN